MRAKFQTITYSVCFSALLAIAGVSTASEPAPDKESLEKAFTVKKYSPYADRNFPDKILWGDTHLHTALSFDAGSFGNRLSPDDAYKFAKGHEVTSSTGYKARLSRPLDFLVIADHSDNMGLFTRIFEGHPDIVGDEEGKRIYDKIQAGGREAVEATVELIDAFSRGKAISPALQVLPGTKAFKNTWEIIVDAAEKANDPGDFTAFIGYEWTSLVEGDNLHRVVMYRDGANMALQTVPFTAEGETGSRDPKDLWKWMEAYEERTGGDVLAIAHNGNLSNGIMFPMTDSFTGKEIDKEYVEQRIKWEPLYEATQIKGDGEAHPTLSPDDEFADYETWDKGNLNLSEAKTDDMLQYEYARSALKLGLKAEEKLGTNPYKFGMIGSTDSHTSLATAAEDNFFGKHAGAEPDVDRLVHVVAQFGENKLEGWEMTASGLAAVWAKENTRRAIFDAMERKETYATTGPRIGVRFFGGWEFTKDDMQNRSPANIGYAKGVPMGGDLASAPDGKAPSFMVYALRDPIGANLDRIQIVKGWVDGKGALQEKVYDVVWSDNRKPDDKGKLPAVGDTVNVEKATWTNSIGAPELGTVWIDPEFDPKQRAFYYARVLEIPKPRWSTYDVVRFGAKAPKGTPTTTQDRAYTSPIWYTP